MDLSGFCRFCLSDEEAQISINADPDLIEKINLCLPNKFSEEDSFPKMICNNCHQKLLETYNFFICIQDTENHYRGILSETKPHTSESDSEIKPLTITRPSKRKSGPCQRISVKSSNKLFSEETLTIQNGESTEVQDVPIKQQSKPIYVCEICDRQFQNLLAFNTHVLNHNNEPPAISCESCGYTTQHRSSMYRHQKRHLKQSKFTCSECNKSFITESLLNEHKNKHTGDKPFKCEACKKSFSLSRYLATHMRLIHGDTVSYVCNQCGRKFEDRSSLALHRRTHKRAMSCLCDICGKELSSREHLKLHKRLHTGEKPNVCTYCGKGFAKQCTLVLHLRTHTGEKPYQCDQCGKTFSQRSSYVIHYRKHTGSRPYVCACGNGFVCRAMLSAHEKTCAFVFPMNMYQTMY
ncbi:zinc finger protein 664-like [Daktulosphaira vitifoliae]|uniref:zinc finger protein 664-like n=1 Tax=Daktulosphaira vitifoliae TaxID=58002 RepID=UPI0021A9EB45|nr:zinc finger protein 664-like [Daktulosphaira vitifoliae]